MLTHSKARRGNSSTTNTPTTCRNPTTSGCVTPPSHFLRCPPCHSLAAKNFGKRIQTAGRKTGAGPLSSRGAKRRLFPSFCSAAQCESVPAAASWSAERRAQPHSRAPLTPQLSSVAGFSTTVRDAQCTAGTDVTMYGLDDNGTCSTTPLVTRTFGCVNQPASQRVVRAHSVRGPQLGCPGRHFIRQHRLLGDARHQRGVRSGRMPRRRAWSRSRATKSRCST